MGLVVVLGAAVGLASSRLPVVLTFAVFGGIALFILIYRNLQLGLVLFLVLNLTIPQAGPTLNLGIQVAVVGETRGLHFNLHEIVITMVFLAWIIKVFLKKADWRAKSPITIAVALYMLTSIFASFIGLINDANELIVIFRLVRTVLFVYIFFLVINLVKTRKQFQRLVIIFLICVTLVAIFGLVQKVMGQTWAEDFSERVLKKTGYPEDVNYVAGESDAQAYRINSTFLHPNVLGGYLVFALPFFVSLMWHYRRWWMRLLLLVGLGTNLATLFLSGSRAAWVAAGCIALIYGVFGFLDKRMILAAATVVLIILLVFAILKPPEFVKKRFVGLSAQEAAQARMYQYKMALDLFMEHPFLGLGAGMEGQEIIENNIRQQWAAVENSFLTILVSHGLIGLSAFLLVFILYWAALLMARGRSPDDSFIYFNSEAFILGMVGFFISNMFGAWLLFAIPMVTLFWFFVGMSGSLYNLSREQEEAA